MSDLFDFYPYAERFGVNRELPDGGRSREEILTELREMATEEDEVWEDGKCSGTMYCGDRDHYAFLKEAFGLFAHQNALQRDMCPSATRFEGEIIAMALSLMHADASRRRPRRDGHLGRQRQHRAGRARLPGGGQGGRAASSARTWSSPRPAIPPSTRPATVRRRDAAGPGRPRDDAGAAGGRSRRRSTRTPSRSSARPATTATGRSTRSRSSGQLALDRGVGLHVDGCLGGYLLPFGEELGYPIPPFDFRVPGVTTISADTHKYGYGLKGTSTLLFRDRELRNRCYFFMPDWSGGKYFSPGMEGSRSDGLLAATWASLVSIGHEGYREYAKRIFETSARMQDAVRSHDELRLLGEPTFLFAFTSDEFDIYHVNDEMKRRGWRFNGLQYPERPAHGRHPPADAARGGGGLRGGSRRGRRLRARARRRARRVERRLRRCAGRPQPRGRGADPRRHDPADGLAAEHPAPRERTARAVPSGSPSPIDLGSGALKVGAVSLAGEIAAVAQRDYETERLPGGGAIQDASAWWEMVRELAGSVLKGIPAERVVAVSCTGPVGEHHPGGRGGRAGRALRDVARHARSAALARRDRRPADGLLAARARDLDPPHRRRPVTLRR